MISQSHSKKLRPAFIDTRVVKAIKRDLSSRRNDKCCFRNRYESGVGEEISVDLHIRLFDGKELL